MSHHGFKLNFAVDHELLTIFIETLTGSTFEMVVTPIDSIASIKAKIQRMEGVLVSQQHLLYNLQELDDQSTVQVIFFFFFLRGATGTHVAPNQQFGSHMA